MKKNSFIFAILFAILFAGCSGGGDDTSSSNETPVVEQTSSNTISGVVDDDPVEGAEVYIDFGDGTLSTKAITDVDGSYELVLSDEDIVKINPEIPEGAEGPLNNLLLIATKDNRVLRNALTRDVADGQTVYITNDTEAYAQYLESIGQFDTISLTEFNSELEKGRIKDDSDKAVFIRDIREDVKTYFYGGEKPTTSSIFAKALTHMGSDKVALVANDSSYVSARNVMSGGDINLPTDVNVSSDDITLTSKGNGRYTVGNGNDSTGIAYLKIQSGDIFKLIPLEIKARVITQLAQEIITPQSGGTIGTETDSISATIPPFALDENKTITFNKIDSEGETTDGKMILDMQPSGTVFEMPITVKINYADFGIEDPNAVEWKYGSIEGGYENADIVSLDTSNKFIYLSISHFSNLTVVKKEFPVIISKPFESGNTPKYNFNNKDYLGANSNGAHLGVDIMKDSGTEIKAVCSGEIIANESTLSNYSNIWARSFVIKCDGIYNEKSIYAVYFHSSINNSFEDVTNLKINSNIKVLIGDNIATVGDLGTNSHLHLGFTYTDNKPQVKDTVCIKKDALIDSNSSSYESGYVTFNISQNSYRFSSKDDSGQGSCSNDEYKIIAGGGYASSADLDKDIVLPNEILSDLGWINPTDLLGGTSIYDFDADIWNSSLIDLSSAELIYPFASSENKYELYISNLNENIRVNLGSHNKDNDHLVTSSTSYTTEGVTLKKLYLQSDDRYNNATGFTLLDNINISSDSSLEQSKLLVIPQIINIEKRIFVDSLSDSELFSSNENSIRLTPFVLEDGDLNVTNNLNAYDGDILNLAQGKSIYFPLEHLGKHEFHLRIPNSDDKDNLQCSYIKSENETQLLAINSSESESIYNLTKWYMLSDSSYLLNGNGYIMCNAIADVQIDALYVKSIDYTVEVEVELNMQIDLSDVNDVEDVELKVVIFDVSTEDRTIVYQGTHTAFEARKIKLSKTHDIMKLKGFVTPRSTNSVGASLLYNPLPFTVEDIENQTSVTLAKITLQKKDMFKPYVKVKVINATNASVITDANVIVKYGNDRADSTTRYSGITDANGEVEFTDIPYGEYTFILNKEGFIDTSLNLTVDEGSAVSTDLSMSPILASGEMRIRLSWGLSPADLDSHLVKKTDGVEDYHIYYSDSNDYRTGDNLDLDDTDGEGPETITISGIDSTSVYTYYVHNYSGDYDGKIKDSGASVIISNGNSEESPIYPIAGGEGEYWRVFTIENGIYKKCIVDCMGTTESTMARSISRVSSSNEADLFRNLPSK